MFSENVVRNITVIGTIIAVTVGVLAYLNLGPAVEVKIVESNIESVPIVKSTKSTTGVVGVLPISNPIQTIHNNVITVKGIGILDTGIQNEAQRIYLGKRAAQADAKRQISEIVATVVKGSTQLQQGLLSNEETHINVASILRFATVVSEKELGNGTIEVTMEAPLNQQ